MRKLVIAVMLTLAFAGAVSPLFTTQSYAFDEKKKKGP
jgi:hypothetical protein